MNEFLQRLKQRKLVQWGLAYVASAFGLLQGIDIVAQQFGWPEGVRRGITLALVVGLFVALVLAWYHGERGAQHVTGTELLIIGLVLALGGGLLWRFSSIKEVSANKPASGPNETKTTPAVAIPEKSIAVLSFENLSDDKANAYFAEGIQDEILTRLSKIAALKVISRTSTQKYQSAPDNLRDVGRQLGVTNLLEGSVQKISSAVHVNVQLIRAATDEHIWAESYNRKLDDVFGVEGEVASAIADQLKAKLSQSEQKAVTDKPTQNTAAYDAYLRGLAIEQGDQSTESYVKATADYGEAIRLDPNFALAWARLATARSYLYFSHLETTTVSAESVKQAADKAMALGPGNGECWVALGVYRYRVLRDFEGAVEAYQEAKKKLPNSSYVWRNLGYVQRRLNEWSQAERSFQRAIALDPRDVQLLSSVAAEFYIYLRRYDDALACIDRALEISPDSHATRGNKATILQELGRINDAARELEGIPSDSVEDWALTARIRQGMYERNYDKVTQAVARRIGGLESNQPLTGFSRMFLVQAGYCYQWAGAMDKAKRAFDRVIKDIQPTPDTVVQPDADDAPTVLALAYAGLGEKHKALELVNRSIRDYANDAVNEPDAEIALAEIQARFVEVDSAIGALPNLLQIPAGLTVTDLKFSPMWDPLRKDPRFQKLIEEKPK